MGCRIIKVWITGLIVIIIGTQVQATWVEGPSPATGLLFYDLVLTEKNDEMVSGCVVGQDINSSQAVIFCTKDSGNSWNQGVIQVGSVPSALRKVFFHSIF